MENKIFDELLDYVFSKSDLDNKNDIPLDKSLLAEGILDSYGIIELVEFIEENWSINIEDNEFTLEKMGSINKMFLLAILLFSTNFIIFSTNFFIILAITI